MKKQIFAITSMVMIAGVMTFTSCTKEDITAPVITIAGGNTINHTLNAAFTAPTATATDDEDGDLTTSIAVSGTVNENLTGTYTLTYTVADAAGNTATETVTVTVANSAAYLSGSYSGADTCQVTGNYTYTATTNVSTTTNGQITINNFAAFGTSINITATATGSSIALGAQPVGTLGNILSGSGVITNSTTPVMHFTFTWTDGTNTESCQSWLTHQ